MKNKIRVMYHSSIRIEDGKILYFDPYNIKNAVHDADCVFITHDHYDHYSHEDIEKVINTNTVIFAPKNMQNKIANENSVFLNPFENYGNGNIKVETIPAYNINKQFHTREKNSLGYIVTLNNIKYYIAGDTDRTPENEAIKCDVALVPVGGKYTMNFEIAAGLVNKIKPKLAIPTHFGSIAGNIEDGNKFKNMLLPQIKCEILTEEF